ncbi:cell cycle checkpoint control protein RAD9B-like isoform X2 [Lineus longissimus]|uniref:cell cycle checkpoint control protein RAD9B-like isoform X2 n=1 Tax=Lineus longissimus TaxID=88925 RepID=UPI00315DC393
MMIVKRKMMSLSDSCLTVFKSLSHLEKTVDRCKITINTKIARVIFQLYCKHGIVKTYNLAFIECETLQAVFSKDLCPNAITAQSRLLCDVVMNFQGTQEEVTLCVNPQKVSLKNYVEDEPDPNKVIHTEMTLNPDEFDSFQVGVDAEVTFCLKELRAILAFSEAGNLPLSMNFESAGKPIVFSIESDSSYEANFVLATLADAPAGSQAVASQSQQTRVQSTSKSQRINTMSSARKRPSESSYNVSNDTVRPSTSKEQKTNGYSKKRDMSKREKRKESSRQLDEALQSLMNDDFEWDPMAGGGDFTSASKKTSEPHPREEELRRDSAGDSNSPEIPVLNQPLKVDSDTAGSSSKPLPILVDDDDDDDDDDDCVPGTPPPPPSKKFKSLFFGFSQASNEPEEKTPTQEVLAEDTDEED